MGPMPVLWMCASQLLEADRVAQEVQQLLREGKRPKDVAVLYRKRRASRRLEVALQARGIGYRLTGGQRLQDSAHAAGHLMSTVFCSSRATSGSASLRAEVKDMLAILHCGLKERYYLAWQRVLQFFPRASTLSLPKSQDDEK